MVEETDSDKLAKQLAWYGILGGAIISVGAAFLASGISVFIAEITLVPNLFAGDSNAAMSINLLSHFFYFLIFGGAFMIGIGVWATRIRIFEKKSVGRKHSWWNWFWNGAERESN